MFLIGPIDADIGSYLGGADRLICDRFVHIRAFSKKGLLVVRAARVGMQIPYSET